MIDYRGLEALHTILEQQSFEGAAIVLHISQSAVSQRLKQLETAYGEPLLIRTLPYRLTPIGELLLAHYSQVSLLEESLSHALGSSPASQRIAIAINRDSLETWFLELIDETSLFSGVFLEVFSDDQELTLEYLKKGEVSACLSTASKEILGGRVDALGTMDYLLAASPAFIKKYGFKKAPELALRRAPALKFDQQDRLHERYLERFYGIDGRELSFHLLPSVRGFKKFVMAGYGYALLPLIDIREELASGQLIAIDSERIWKIPLYWHSYAIQSSVYEKFNREMIAQIKKRIKFPSP